MIISNTQNLASSAQLRRWVMETGPEFPSRSDLLRWISRSMSSPLLRILQQCLYIPQALLINPKYFWYLAALVIIADALLTGFVIQFVPCQSVQV